MSSVQVNSDPVIFFTGWEYLLNIMGRPARFYYVTWLNMRLEATFVTKATVGCFSDLNRMLLCGNVFLSLIYLWTLPNGNFVGPFCTLLKCYDWEGIV